MTTAAANETETGPVTVRRGVIDLAFLGKRRVGHRRLQDRPRGTTIDIQARHVLWSASRKLCRHVADAHR